MTSVGQGKFAGQDRRSTAVACHQNVTDTVKVTVTRRILASSAATNVQFAISKSMQTAKFGSNKTL